ncbi:MAG TPA: DNA repair protein RadC [Thermoanaerobaculia bacterium]|nr:DNA repair protein RadC [Thermoanaerobaculia bacterium]
MSGVIRDLPVDERPRERLLQHGAATLSNAELIAILLGSGTPGRNAIQLGREMLKEGGGLSALPKRDPAQFTKIPGLGMAKITRVLAALELGQRILNNEPEEPPAYDSGILGRALLGYYAQHRQERLGAVFLDTRRRILKQAEIYIGTINNALVSTRDIITHALMENATAVVVYHNHPSGDPVPSEEDQSFTDKLKVSLGHCDIDLIDHLIVGAHRYYSMREQGRL